MAWTAFAVLIATGVWNIVAERDQVSGRYQTTLIVKLAVVAASGLTAAVHVRARRPATLAVFGALTGLTAVGALFLGVLLAGEPPGRTGTAMDAPGPPGLVAELRSATNSHAEEEARLLTG